MSTIRRELRRWVTAWLVFQAVSLSAFVPLDCCAAHRTAAVEPRCHEEPAVAHCPMHASDSTPCPMHRVGHSEQPPTERCAMCGACGGPMAALFASLSNHGVLTDTLEILPDQHGSRITLQARDNLISRLPSLDPPPPRA